MLTLREALSFDAIERKPISYQELDDTFPGAIDALLAPGDYAPITSVPSEMQFWVEDGELMTLAPTEYGDEELMWLPETGEWLQS